MVIYYFSIDLFLIPNLIMVIKYHNVACINTMHQVVLCARVTGTVGNLRLFLNFRNHGYEIENLTSQKGTNYETRSNQYVNKYVNGIS